MIELILDQTQMACEALFIEPGNIFKRNLHEQTVTFRLGVHLQECFPDYLVDCEYNRNVLRPKELKSKKRFRPDVIVHRRELVGSEHSLLVVEAKKPKDWNASYNDLCHRLQELTRIGGQFEYQLGFCWKIEPIQSLAAQEAHWFYDGKRVAQTSFENFTEAVLRGVEQVRREIPSA